MSHCRLGKFHWPVVELILKSKHLTLAYTAWYSLAPACLGSILLYDSSPWPQDASLLGLLSVLQVHSAFGTWHQLFPLPGLFLPLIVVPVLSGSLDLSRSVTVSGWPSSWTLYVVILSYVSVFEFLAELSQLPEFALFPLLILDLCSPLPWLSPFQLLE